MIELQKRNIHELRKLYFNTCTKTIDGPLSIENINYVDNICEGYKYGSLVYIKENKLKEANDYLSQSVFLHKMKILKKYCL